LLVAGAVCAVAAFLIWFNFRAPFESPRFVIAGALPGTVVAAVGSFAAAISVAATFRQRNVIAWAVTVLVINVGYLLLFGLSLPR
jgi:hypothetical protein